MSSSSSASIPTATTTTHTMKATKPSTVTTTPNITGIKRRTSSKTSSAKRTASSLTARAKRSSSSSKGADLLSSSSSAALKDVESGIVQIPQSITQHFQLLNDIDDDQCAFYPDEIIVNNGGGMNVDDDDVANLRDDDPMNPPFQVRDYSTSSAACDILDDSTTPMFAGGPPPPQYYGTSANYFKGKYPASSESPCMYCEETFENTPACMPVEWDPLAPPTEQNYWGNWCWFPCLLRWTMESNIPNKGHVLLSIGHLMRVVFGVSDPAKIGIAPSKYVASSKWGGPMNKLASTSASEICSTFAHSDARFTPTPLILQINRFAANRINAANQVAQAVFDANLAPTGVSAAELAAELDEHVCMSTLDTGVRYDTTKKRWIDVHNMKVPPPSASSSTLRQQELHSSNTTDMQETVSLPPVTLYNPPGESLPQWKDTNPKDANVALTAAF